MGSNINFGGSSLIELLEELIAELLEELLDLPPGGFFFTSESSGVDACKSMSESSEVLSPFAAAICSTRFLLLFLD